jgi:hypothetical protein
MRETGYFALNREAAILRGARERRMNDGRIDSAREGSWASACQNCGAPLTGRFCSSCGQRAIPPRPTVRELAGDAWNELVGWDGKFLRTLRMLVRHPGELTRAAIEGRRARYISPVRLYLVCSIVYFLVAAAAPLPDEEVAVTVGFDAGLDVGIGASDPTGAAFDKAVRVGLDALTPDERALVEAEIARQPAVFRPLMRGLLEDYGSMQRRMVDILSRALFVLVPVLGLVLAMFYRGRHYPEHLYAALHLQTFVFLALTFQALAEYTRSGVVGVAARMIAAIVIVAYAVVAQRHIYGDSWPKTVIKAVCVAAIYGTLWGTTSFGVALVAARG